MPDFQNLVVTTLSNANVNMQRYNLSVQVTDSTTGAVLHDFTGANSIIWPAIWTTLTGAQRRDILETIRDKIIYMKAGLDGTPE